MAFEDVVVIHLFSKHEQRGWHYHSKFYSEGQVTRHIEMLGVGQSKWISHYWVRDSDLPSGDPKIAKWLGEEYAGKKLILETLK